jgi:hypothetical protein
MHRNIYRVEVLVKKTLLWRPGRRWEETVEIDLSETRIKIVDRIELPQCKF